MIRRLSGGDFGIGVDMGGTFTKIVLCDPRGRPLVRTRVETLARLGPRRFVARVVDAIESLGPHLKRAGSVGLGAAGDVDPERGRLRFSPNIKEFTGFGFQAAFRSRLRLPVTVDNDANMAAWGGYVVELKRGPANVVCLTLGTGIGGGLIVDGKLYHGATGTAGEIGHVCVEPGGAPCHCGAKGCLEAYAGSYGILRVARRLLTRRGGGDSPILRRLCPDFKELDTKILAQAAWKGDPVAREAWRISGRYLGIGIADMIQLMNPEVVLLVGGVACAGELLLAPIRKVLGARPFRVPFKRARLKIARKHHLGAVGAALWGLESLCG